MFSTNEKLLNKLLDHDLSKRGKVEFALQHNYLLSLGPCQSHYEIFPTNYDKQRKTKTIGCLMQIGLRNTSFGVQFCIDAAFCFICSLFPNGPNRLWAKHCWTLSGVRTWSKMKSYFRYKICEVLTKNSLNLGSIAFQSYDFASNMSGHLQEIQIMLFKMVDYNIPYIPCQAHRLNTFVEHSFDASINVA